jgi:hypothetical protein
MSKMGLHDPFEYLQHKLWQKKWGRESKCQFNSQPLKIKNPMSYVRVACMPHIIGKILMKATTFF